MRRRVLVLAAAVALVAFLVGALVSLPARGAPSDRASLREDLWHALGEAPPLADGFVVVGMTDPTGWARFARADADADRIRTAGLVATIERLAEEGAALVVLTELLDTEDLRDGDAAEIVRVVAEHPVLASFLDAAPITASNGGARTFTSRFRAPLLGAAKVPLAHVVVPRGTDVVRGLPLLARHREQDRSLLFVTATVGAVLALAEGVDRPASQGLRLDDGALVVGSVRVPHVGGTMRITWSPRLVDRVPGTTSANRWRADAPFVDAAALLDAPLGTHRDQVEGQIVVLGSIDPLRADYRTVPGGPDGGVPELWVHANALNTILADAHRVPPPVAAALSWVALLAVAGAALTSRLPVGRATVWVAAIAVGFLVVVGARLGRGELLDPIGPLVALGLAWLGTFAARYAVEGRQRRRVAQLFKSYVPDAVAGQLIEQRVSLESLAAGQRVDITVLFCDLRGFTAQAATLEPPDVRDLLNVYYRHMAAIILGQAGTVMQYVGDEVFAVFGAPLHQDDHAERAVEAATRMQDAAREIAEELAGSGIAPISYGIGVHSGQVVAAHVGDDVRRQYSVVGDTVNVGARLCSQAGAGEVVISEDVVARLPEAGRWSRAELDLDQVTDVVMKGVSRDFGIFRLGW